MKANPGHWCDGSAAQAVSPALSLDHPRVIAALEDYQTALEAGRPANRPALLREFPEIAADLQDCLEGMELLHNSNGPAAIKKDAAPAILGEPIGDYKLLREVGRGGMGIVYEAEQLSLGRRVALKVLPLAATLDPRQLQRFKQEAQAAACLHHPHIVPVYAVGQERGVHYYAMQFIDGKTLSCPIKELRQRLKQETLTSVDGSDKSGGSSTDAAADLITERSIKSTRYFQHIATLGKRVAEALDHAHQFGVVHRDIKPANLLLDHGGNIWITDFGLARLECEIDLTLSGDLVGTLRYMSPEQASAKRNVVDHRTDIYALGATLYELITLEPVFNGESRQAILEQIANEEPRRPRHFNKSIPVDLETIILKALAKNPAERFATAQEFAEDLNRFLIDKPIRAKRPSLTSRIAKWSRRHRSFVAASFVLLLLIAAGLGVSNFFVWQEQAKTQIAYEREAKQRKRAEVNYELAQKNFKLAQKNFKLAQENFKQARAMLDFYTRVTEEELADYPGLQEVRQQVLETSLRYYQGFIDKSKADPRMQEELSESYFRVATILTEMGERKKAEDSFTKAVNLQHRLVSKRPDDNRLRSNLNSMYQTWGWKQSDQIIQQLARRSVRADLRMTAAQQKEVDSALAEYNSLYQPKHGPLTPAWHVHMKQSQKKKRRIVDELTALLTPKQHRRLRQISLQERGAFAFNDPQVVSDLKLTKRQRQKIQSILKKQIAPHRSRGGRGFRFGGSFRKSDSMNDILGTLTAEQRPIWNEMLGRPYFGGDRFPSFGRGGFPFPRRGNSGLQ